MVFAHRLRASQLLFCSSRCAQSDQSSLHFPYPKPICSLTSIIPHWLPDKADKVGHRRQNSTLSEAFRLHQFQANRMPPKQATLGLVKPSQQTLGCIFGSVRSQSFYTNYAFYAGNSSGSRRASRSQDSSLPWLSISLSTGKL